MIHRRRQRSRLHLHAAIAGKAHALEMIARTLEQHTPTIDAEIKRLTALKAQRQRVADALRDYVRRCMVAGGVEKIECPLFRLRLQNNPPRVEIFDERMVPAGYMARPEPPPARPDRRAIAEAIKRGEDVPGAKLVQEQRLVVK